MQRSPAARMALATTRICEQGAIQVSHALSEIPIRKSIA